MVALGLLEEAKPHRLERINPGSKRLGPRGTGRPCPVGHVPLERPNAEVTPVNGNGKAHPEAGASASVAAASMPPSALSRPSDTSGFPPLLPKELLDSSTTGPPTRGRTST